MTPSELYDAARGCWVVGRRADNQKFLIASYAGVVRFAMTIEAWIPVGDRRYAAEGQILAAGNPVFDTYVGRQSPVERSYGNPVAYIDSPFDHSPGETAASPDLIEHAYPVPVTTDQRILLRAVWDAVPLVGWWPTFADLDRPLWTGHRVDIVKVAKTLPAGLLYGGLAGNLISPRGDVQIGLTVAGAAACDGAEETIDAFIAGVQLAVVHEGDPAAPAEIRVDAAVLAQRFGDEDLLDRDLLLRVGALFYTEGSLWTGFSGMDRNWFATIGRQIRDYDGVETLDEFWTVAHGDDGSSASTHNIAAAWPSNGDPAVPSNEVQDPGTGDSPDGAKIFIVHGHNDGLRHELARFLGKLTGAEPIILAEQADAGLTVIEKFEKHANEVGYAVILATADDLGRAKHDAENQPRARQNVVFEMGYFFARLGRAKVAVLHESAVEIPSDIAGLVYIPSSNSSEWKSRIARELKQAGFAVNGNALL